MVFNSVLVLCCLSDKCVVGLYFLLVLSLSLGKILVSLFLIFWLNILLFWGLGRKFLFVRFFEYIIWCFLNMMWKYLILLCLMVWILWLLIRFLVLISILDCLNSNLVNELCIKIWCCGDIINDLCDLKVFVVMWIGVSLLWFGMVWLLI